MRALGVLGFLLAVAALGLSGMMYRTAQQEKNKPKEVPEEAKQVAALSTRVGAVETAQKDAKAGVAKLGGAVGALETGQADIKEELEKIRDDIAALKKQGEAAEAAPPVEAAEVKEGVTEERVREILREEQRAMMDRMRNAAGRQRGGDNRTELQQNVGLDEAKSQQVAALLDKEREDIGNLWRNNRGGDREQITAQMQELQKKTSEEVAKILTAEELEKYNKWREERNNRGFRGRGDRGRGDRGDRGEGDAGGAEGQGEAENPDAVF